MKTNLHVNLILVGLILFVFISVNSSAQLNWEKYEANPVMQVQQGSWYEWNVFFPVVIHEDNIFKMWFCGSNENPGRHIGYATSPDGLEWEIFAAPVISGGDPGNWAAHVYPGSVLRINDTLRMWFSGSTSSGDNGSIGYAWSVEEYDWNVLSEPILEKGESGTWEDEAVFHPSVYFDESMSMYHMYYSGSDDDFETMQIGHATSLDGLNWVKEGSNNPVIPFGPSGSFYDTWVTARPPIMHDDTLRMFFAGFDGTTTYPINGYYSFVRVGYAWTTDFTTWIVHSDPVVDVGEAGEWDETMVHGPSVMIHDGRYKMWYWGDSYNWYWEIGYALGDTVTISGLWDNIQFAGEIISVYPNPFTDNVILSYTIQKRSMVEIEMYNYKGQLVSTLINEVKTEGKYETIFEGPELQSGVYFCFIITNSGIQTTKMVKL